MCYTEYFVKRHNIGYVDTLLNRECATGNTRVNKGYFVNLKLMKYFDFVFNTITSRH